jgi:cbb3-type cytochrome c oxidase subunit III
MKGENMKKNLPGLVGLLIVGLLIVMIYTTPSAESAQKDNTQPVDAKAVFEKHCATCHGKDGQAKTFKAKFDHARNLTDAKWQAEVTDERISNSITNGKGKMPAWGKKLSEAQINALVGYVRKFKK